MVTGSDRMTRIATMLFKLKWISIQNQSRLQHCYFLDNVLKRGICGTALLLISVYNENQQGRYTLRDRDLRIAWVPKLSRVGARSLMVVATSTWNQLQLSQFTFPKDKKVKKRQVMDKIIASYGLGHKP